MHLLLTDRLSCPRCGPGFGLILLANQLVDRRVLSGSLGCSNCRDRFPIDEGFADLRPPPRTPPSSAPPPPPDEASTTELAALLGLTEGPGWVGLLGTLAAHAGPLADRIPGIEVVALDAGARSMPEREGVSRAVVGPTLPFTPWTFRALAATGGVAPLEEIAPLVARGGRIVVQRPEEGTADALERLRIRPLLDRAEWIVGLKETV